MKILVTEMGKDIVMRIYGTDGEECTKEFFEMYLLDSSLPVYVPSEKLLKEYNSEAEFAVDKIENIVLLAEEIPDIQAAIDDYRIIAEDGQKTSDLRQYIV